MTLALIGIALLDSLNPSLFIGQFILFAGRRPLPRVFAYLVGVLATNFIGGIVFVAGIRIVIENLVRQLDPRVGLGLLLVVGIASIVFGLRYKAEPMAAEDARQPPLSLWKAFTFGIVVMGNELTTAFPYLVASERIAGAEAGWGANLLLLGLYNFVFALPLFGFLGAFLFLRERFTAQTERISQAVRIWSPRLGKYLALLFGVGLSGYALVRLAQTMG